jgi:hypothetical protein
VLADELDDKEDDRRRNRVRFDPHDWSFHEFAVD